MIAVELVVIIEFLFGGRSKSVNEFPSGTASNEKAPSISVVYLTKVSFVADNKSTSPTATFTPFSSVTTPEIVYVCWEYPKTEMEYKNRKVRFSGVIFSTIIFLVQLRCSGNPKEIRRVGIRD